MTRSWQSDQLSHEEIRAALRAASPSLDLTDQQAGATLYRMLSLGKAVAPTAFAERMGWPTGDGLSYLRSGQLATRVEWGGSTDGDVVIGFGGLTTRNSRHSLIVDGRRLSTWCAWDAMFIPRLLGKPATIESVCPQSGSLVRIRIDGDTMERMVDREPVLSFKLPDPARRFISCDQEILEFCGFVNLLTTRQAGTTWISTRPGTFLLSIGDAFTMAQTYNEDRYGSYLHGDPSPPNGHSRGEVA